MTEVELSQSPTHTNQIAAILLPQQTIAITLLRGQLKRRQGPWIIYIALPKIITAPIIINVKFAKNAINL